MLSNGSLLFGRWFIHNLIAFIAPIDYYKNRTNPLFYPPFPTDFRFNLMQKKPLNSGYSTPIYRIFPLTLDLFRNWAVFGSRKVWIPFQQLSGNIPS
jgi:hypothetical protein